MIRKATVRDVKAIHRLLKKYADRGELLPRALGELYGDVREFSAIILSPKEPHHVFRHCP